MAVPVVFDGMERRSGLRIVEDVASNQVAPSNEVAAPQTSSKTQKKRNRTARLRDEQ